MSRPSPWQRLGPRPIGRDRSLSSGATTPGGEGLMASRSRRIRPFFVGALSATLLLSAVLAATVVAGDRIPISSVDDGSLSQANRISAVDNVIVAIEGRLQRIIGAIPPGPPVIPVSDGLSATRQSLGTIIGTVDSRLCTQDGVFGQGDASLADGDAFATDASSTGLVNQLSSVRGVVSEANGRLIRILRGASAGTAYQRGAHRADSGPDARGCRLRGHHEPSRRRDPPALALLYVVAHEALQYPAPAPVPSSRSQPTVPDRAASTDRRGPREPRRSPSLMPVACLPRRPTHRGPRCR